MRSQEKRSFFSYFSAADVVSPMCEVEIVGGRVGPGTHNTSVGGVEPHWERMLGLEQIDPCTSPLVSERARARGGAHWNG